jgi:D-glycero-D-manno-heptose 1,7-bisphosphate phosphatase/D-glycero-alpha-D-manno-heptose 1-phosphate guanylyltransferase
MGNTSPYNALFLDRDGVINRLRKGDYVKSWEEFVFIDGALEALAILSSLFTRIIVVTNQRGVGRGLMTPGALEEIHSRMLHEITSHGGRIDGIYCCTSADPEHFDRKPNIGMALRAKADFPDICFAGSLCAGDSLSDIAFACRVGMKAVFIGQREIFKVLKIPSFAGMKVVLIRPPGCAKAIEEARIDASYPDLLTFAGAIQTEIQNKSSR